MADDILPPEIMRRVEDLTEQAESAGDRIRAWAEAASDEPDWVAETRNVLDLVLAERKRQVAEYGFNETLEDGTGPHRVWLYGTSGDLHLLSAVEIEQAFREEYGGYSALHGQPTWMHLVREEIAEAFKEEDPEPLIAELTQVAALCVSWIERIRARG